MIGATIDENEEEDDGSVVSGDFDRTRRDGCYQIVSTFKDKSLNKTRDKPFYIKDILQYKTKEELLEHLIECDMIVYDITEEPSAIDEAVWVVSELHADLERIEKPKMFILVSSVMTWANSKPLDPVSFFH